MAWPFSREWGGSTWRERIGPRRTCPYCGADLPEASLWADPDKLFLFGLIFIMIGLVAWAERAEGYVGHVLLGQILLGAGLIGWSVFRYREQRKAYRRHRRHRTTPRLVDVIAQSRTMQRATSASGSSSAGNPSSQTSRPNVAPSGPQPGS